MHYISNRRNQKNRKTKIMKKVVIAGVIGVFTLGMMSCGAGHGGCDAYRKSDYTKYKEVKTQKMEIINAVKVKLKK